MKSIKTYCTSVLILTSILVSASLYSQKSLKIEVNNPSKFERQEVVAVKVKSIVKFLKGKKEADIRVVSQKLKTALPIQWLDLDLDGHADELLFYVKIPSSSSEQFTLEANSNIPQAVNLIETYSRFVPERTDDYAWENDKVAFRTYGPDAQKRAEEHRPNGTLTSGIDLWLKRTDKLIINKWYKGYETNPMFYHTDRGEGYDPYHVGASRGTGGSGIWEKDSLLVSKNFVTYKTITTGPLRTIFELTYNPYSSYGVKETKRISLDVGSNFSKFEINYASTTAVPNYTIGITLHENKGQTEVFKEQGIFIHNETIDGVYLGEGLVFSSKDIQDVIVNKSKVKEQSNLLVITKPTGKITYFAGFAWGKGGQATTAEEWLQIVKNQSEIVAKPLTVKVLNVK